MRNYKIDFSNLSSMWDFAGCPWCKMYNTDKCKPEHKMEAKLRGGKKCSHFKSRVLPNAEA